MREVRGFSRRWGVSGRGGSRGGFVGGGIREKRSYPEDIILKRAGGVNEVFEIHSLRRRLKKAVIETGRRRLKYSSETGKGFPALRAVNKDGQEKNSRGNKLKERWTGTNFEKERSGKKS